MVEIFKFLTGILEEEEKKTCKILTVLSLLSPVMDIFNFSVILYIINTVMREKKASEELIIFTFFMGILSILKGFFEIYKCKVSSRFVYNGAQKLSVKICELQIKEDLEHHNEKSAVQALMLVRNDTEKCIEIIVSCIEIWVNILSIIEYFIVLIYVSKWVGFVSCIILLLFIIVMFFQYRIQMQTYGEKRRKYAIKANAQVTIAHGIFKEMKIGNSSGIILQRYKNISQQYAQVQGDFQYKNSIVSMIMQNMVMSALFIILALFLCSPQENLVFIVSSMVVYITVLVKMIPVAYGIVSDMNHVEFSKKSYEVLKECLLRYDQMKAEEKSNEKIRRKKLTFQRGLMVRNLTFNYNERAKIFDDARINIPTGHSVAIVGVSGAGKTTFLDLILGLLKPQAGDILYDDYNIVSQRDLQGMCKASLGDIVSYIPQIVYLNGETVRDNVAFFEEEDKIDDEKVEECLKCAQIWEDVVKMPNGVHTLIGENGTAISGGQRQRIALARALYKDFDLLVMDEATAALDMETEKAVIDSMREMKGKKTILMATHHMSLANECDYIYRIENRKIVRIK